MFLHRKREKRAQRYPLGYHFDYQINPPADVFLRTQMSIKSHKNQQIQYDSFRGVYEWFGEGHENMKFAIFNIMKRRIQEETGLRPKNKAQDNTSTSFSINFLSRYYLISSSKEAIFFCSTSSLNFCSVRDVDLASRPNTHGFTLFL